MQDEFDAWKFPSIEELANSTQPLNPVDREVVDKWHTLSCELQAMVPHIAQLLVNAIGGPTTWRDMTEAKRNIMSYTAISLLAEAQKRAAVKSRPNQPEPAKRSTRPASDQ